MTRKEGIEAIFAIIILLIVAPIWYYLLYKILVAVQATDLMWFLYWIYVPAQLLAHILEKISKAVR